MQKSSSRHHEESHAEKKFHASKIHRGNLKNAKAPDLVGELGKTVPAIKKFSRDNWKMIAMLSAGISVIAAATYIYFYQEEPSTSPNRHH